MSRALSPLALAYSILAGPILWFVHFVLVYSVAEFGCRANFNNLVFLTPENIRAIVLVLTIVALIAVGVGGVLAYQGWKKVQTEHHNESSRQDRSRFLIVTAMLLSGLFLPSIIFTAAPAFFLNACDRVL